MADFRELLHQAHRRGLRVITELVLNHTSDRHPWFSRARRAPPGSAERDFYVWSDRPQRYRGARVIFSDAESSNWDWDPRAGAWYWHRFYRHQPDLNYESVEVRRQITRVVDFWLEQGVDGLRLDAAPFLFEREETSCESLPETHGFLRDLRVHVEGRFPGAMLLAEANQRPDEAAGYFGEGDEAHMAFHFPLMPRMFLAAAMEDRSPVVDVLWRTPPIPDACQWALFLRNHDELSLEMVSEDERQLMHGAYAVDPRARLNEGIRRRLAPLLRNRRSLLELMEGLLLSLAGTPVLYYGDEIGMGDDLSLPDRDGIRTPMQWSSGPGAGFSGAPAGHLYPPLIRDDGYGPGVVNVESQAADPGSLLNWLRRVIAVRQRCPAFARGSLEVVDAGSRRVLAFLRTHGDERVLVAANLGAGRQDVDLRGSGLGALSARDLLTGAEVPLSGAQLSLPSHGFVWLSLDPLGRNGNGTHDEAPALEGSV
jgi:maltose alpha-D-glucosyltransferase / alpha-amylase